MLPRLLPVLAPVLGLAGLLVLSACGSRGATAPPATTVAPGGPPTADLTDAQLLAQLPACAASAACTVTSRVAGVGPAGRFTVALVQRAGTDPAVPLPDVFFAVEDPGAGRVTDVLPRAPLEVAAAGRLERDATGHVFSVLRVGANGEQVVVLSVDAAGRLATFGSLTDTRDYGFDTGSRFVGSRVAEARDLDGDGVREIVVGKDDCRPDCAHGTVLGDVWRWDGHDYALAGCLPYDARLHPAAVPRAGRPPTGGC